MRDERKRNLPSSLSSNPSPLQLSGWSQEAWGIEARQPRFLFFSSPRRVTTATRGASAKAPAPRFLCR